MAQTATSHLRCVLSCELDSDMLIDIRGYDLEVQGCYVILMIVSIASISASLDIILASYL